MTSVQLIASLTVNPEAPEAFEAYLEVAMKLIDKAGGKIVQQIEVGEPIIGKQPSKMLMLVDYPSQDAIEEVFKSEAYRAIIPTRDTAFLTYDICIVAKNDLVEGTTEDA